MEQQQVLPTIIDKRYRVESRIGMGSMGEIFRAYDYLSKSEVALKRVLLQTGRPSRDDEDNDSNPAMALAHEFRILATLRHPHIISVLDFGFDEQRRPYYTMELLPHVMPITTHESDVAGKIKLLIQLMEALSYLHRRGILHRDLKPNNILYEIGVGVRVLDFGLALQGRVRGVGVAGTVSYMPPEILRGEDPSPASDLFSAGIVAYEFITGLHPFAGEHITATVAAIISEEPDYTPFFVDSGVGAIRETHTTATLNTNNRDAKLRRQMIPIINRLLAKQPARRFQDALSVAESLRKLVGDSEERQQATVHTKAPLNAPAFVGREAEMESLLAHLQDTRLGKGYALLVGGESGVGKTRLIEELRIRAMVKGVLVLQGGCTPRRVPFQALQAPLAKLVLGTPIADDEAQILRRIVPDIEQLLGRAIPDRQDGIAIEQISAVLINILRRVEQPSMLIIEDLQWATVEIEVIQSLARVLRDHPLFIVCTYRSEDRPDLSADMPALAHMRLNRLRESSVAALSASILGEIGQHPKLVSFLMLQTEGNAYFLSESLRALRDIPDLHERLLEGKRLIAADSIDDLIRQRLAHMPTASQPLLRVAAIVGRTINREIMLHFVQPKALAAWLAVGLELGVLENMGGFIRFSHERLRDIILEDMPAMARRNISREVAQAFEAQHPNDPSAAALLYEYFEMAEDYANSTAYALVAARRYFEAALFSKARPLCEAILAHTPPEQHADRLEPLRMLGTMLMNMGEVETAEQYLFQVLFHADHSAGSPEAIHALCALATIRLRHLESPDIEGASHYLQAADNIATEYDLKTLRPMIDYHLGQLAHLQNDLPKAHDILMRAVERARQLPKPGRYLSYALNDLGFIAFVRHNLTLAEEYFSAVVEWAEHVGSYDHIEALGNLGEVARMKGDFDKARDYYTQSRRLAYRIGKAQTYVHNTVNLALLEASATQNAEQAVIYAREALNIAHQSQYSLGLLNSLIAFGAAFAVRGDADRAAELLGVVLAHPAMSATVQHDIDSVRALLAKQRKASEIETGIRRGKALDFKETVAALLAPPG